MHHLLAEAPVDRAVVIAWAIAAPISLLIIGIVTYHLIKLYWDHERRKIDSDKEIKMAQTQADVERARAKALADIIPPFCPKCGEQLRWVDFGPMSEMAKKAKK